MQIPAPRPTVLTRKDDELGQRFAEDYVGQLFDGIHESMLGHSRSQQKLIGPSEIGVPCDRALLYKLAQHPEPPRAPGWKPQVGTYAHAGMETVFGTPDRTRAGWLCEERLLVGRIGRDDIYGSCDLFHAGGLVNDWKFVGSKKLKKVKADRHPGDQYRAQAHLYGKGWEDDGYPVHVVMITFLPRDGELGDGYVWWETYNRQIAEDALDRANTRLRLLQTVGLEQAVALFPFCDDFWCQWCKADNSVASAAGMFSKKTTSS